MTTPPDDVTSGLNASSSTLVESGDELLWLWYVVFTVVLLGLIAASFVRFHYKRLQQQKQRLDAEAMYGVKRRHTTPSPSNSNHGAGVMTPAAVVNLDTQRLLHPNDVGGRPRDLEVRGHGRSRGREDGYVKRMPVVYTFNANHINSRGHEDTEVRPQTLDSAAKDEDTDYTFNANGSMVDVRCEQVERCNTFRFDNDYGADDQHHIHLPSSDLEDLKDVDESRRQRSCLRNSHDPLTSRSLGHEVDGNLLQSNHHPQSFQLHHFPHHPYQSQQQQQQPRQRLSPSHHRSRHRQKMSSSATRTSLLHPSRLGREYLASSDEELSRSAAAAEALMLWQKR